MSPGRVIKLSVVRLGQMLSFSAKLADRDEVERAAWQQHVTEPPARLRRLRMVWWWIATLWSSLRGGLRTCQSGGRALWGRCCGFGPYTGVEVESMEPQLAQFFGAGANSGVLVHVVEANSPGAAAGLHAGDVVVRVDNVSISTPAEFARRVRAAGGRAVSLLVLREKREQVVSMMPDYKRHSLLEWPKFF